MTVSRELRAVGSWHSAHLLFSGCALSEGSEERARSESRTKSKVLIINFAEKVNNHSVHTYIILTYGWLKYKKGVEKPLLFFVYGRLSRILKIL